MKFVIWVEIAVFQQQLNESNTKTKRQLPSRLS